MPTEQEKIEKLLDLGQSVKAKIYQNFLKKIADGKTLSAAEYKEYSRIEIELQSETETKKSTVAPLLLGSQETADFFGVTRQALQYWLSVGCPKEGRGTWDLKKVHDWQHENIEDSGGDDASVNAARLLNWNLKNEKLRIEIDETKGALFPRDQIATAWKWRIGEVKTGLESLKDRLPGVLLGKDHKQMRKILESEVRDLLDNYSRHGKFTPTVKEQVKPKKKVKAKPKEKKKRGRPRKK